jgi:outer membrane receptor protein involved in Fe transport
MSASILKNHNFLIMITSRFNYFFLFSFVVISYFPACQTSRPGPRGKEREIVLQVGREVNPLNEVSPGSNNAIQLVDYLRRIPGIQIDQKGNEVSLMIRGANSISGENSPLFVINNQPVGNNYLDAVSAVDVNDIKYVQVLKGPEGQQLYGMRGFNGVIQIFTKKK